MAEVLTHNPNVITTTIGKYRWRIVALLFFATTINYIDRNVLSFVMLNDDFKRDMLGLGADAIVGDAERARFKELMGYVDACFKAAYAFGFIIMGWFIDKVGTRRGYATAIFIWALSAISHSFVKTIGGLGFARIGLGIGEAGNFPSAIKTVAEWFPKKERSFATGVFNAGANIGIITTAFSVPFFAATYGWRTTFIITSTLGFILLILWILTYRKVEEHPKVSKAELEYIKSDQEQVTNKKISWFKLLGFKQTWAFAIGKFMTDPVWWLYLTWLPTFFSENDNFETKLNLSSIGIPFLIIYLVSDGGSVLFGWLSSYFIKNGWSINRARKVTMLICALCVLPISFAAMTNSIYIAIALISLATAAHQGWSANIFTTTSDMFPKQAVGSVVGIGGMFGAIGGAIMAGFGGFIYASYGPAPLFMIASGAYLTALLIIHLLVPKLQPADLKLEEV